MDTYQYIFVKTYRTKGLTINTKDEPSSKPWALVNKLHHYWFISDNRHIILMQGVIGETGRESRHKGHGDFCCTALYACSVMSDSATPWTEAHPASLSTEFSRQEHWSGLPFPPPGDLPNPGIKPMSTVALALTGRFFTPEHLVIQGLLYYVLIFYKPKTALKTKGFFFFFLSSTNQLKEKLK